MNTSINSRFLPMSSSPRKLGSRKQLSSRMPKKSLGMLSRPVNGRGLATPNRQAGFQVRIAKMR